MLKQRILFYHEQDSFYHLNILVLQKEIIQKLFAI